MASNVMVPTVATAGATWTNPSNALTQNSSYATCADSTAPFEWLRLSALTNRTISLSNEIVGVVVTVYRAMTGILIPPEQFHRIELALSIDGVNPIGDTRVIELASGYGPYTAGAEDDDWGTGLTPALLDSPNAAILIRRPTLAAEAYGITVSIDFAYAEAFHAPIQDSFMSQRTTSLQRTLLGKETTRGEAVACPLLVKDMNMEFSPDMKFGEIREDGSLMASHHPLITEASTISGSGTPCFNHIGYWLSSVVSKPASQQIAAASGSDPAVHDHEFVMAIRGYNDPNTFTLEKGDDDTAERVKYAIMTELGLVFKRDSMPTQSGSFFAHPIEDATITQGSDEVQTLTITATGGTYRLKYKGARTSALNHNANAAAIQAALEALDTVGAGDLAVAGTGPYTITGAAAFDGKSLYNIEVDTASLTGGSATIAETTRGGYTLLAHVPMPAGKVSCYYATTLAGLAAGKMTDCYLNEFNIGGRFSQVWVNDEGSGSFKAAVEAPTTATQKIKVEANDAGNAFHANARVGAERFLRLIVNGPVIQGSYSYQMEITQFTVVNGVESFGPEGDVYARGYQLASKLNESENWAFRIRLRNTVASY